MNPTQVTSSRAKHPVFEFNGVRFHLHPDSGYYARVIGGRKRYLHREVWSAARGPIPAGHHIHHKNHDPADNRLENLECVPGGRHVRMHALGGSPARRAGLQRRRDRSGLVDLTCERCGCIYQKLAVDAYKSRHCSPSCVTAARVASGVDDIEVACEVCAKPFRRNKYKRKKACSPECREVARQRSRRAA